MALNLNTTDPYIFRITHIDNLPWILLNGLHCKSSPIGDPNFVQIGSTGLIAKRATRSIPPYGTLSDFVPFYFTPRSPMFLNIKTGHSGVTQHPMSDIVVLVCKFIQIQQAGLDTLFTDRHAYLQTAQFYNSPADLGNIDWNILKSSDFKYDSNDPEKMERYQAEALVRGHVPPNLIAGIACVNEKQKVRVEAMLGAAGVTIKVKVVSEWFP